MNRFTLGLSLLVFAPLCGGCGLYITAPPAPEPTPRPPKKPLQYPFDPAQGVGLTGAPTDKGLAMNGAPGFPVSFRAADVVFAPRSSNDTANFTPLLILQPMTADAQGNATVPGTADVNNPVRLAGVIVPAPNTPGYEEALQATRNWAQGQPVVVGAPGATPLPSTVPVPGTTRTATATATPVARAGKTGAARATATISVVTPGAGARAMGTAVPVAYIASQPLDVYQDPKSPIDSENRRLVEVFFKSVNATKAVPAGTQLSLNRMLIRSGWAVVDLYSPTAFDQQSWLLDESYARRRKLGLWRYGVALQQRLPEVSTGTGAQSSISIIAGTIGTPSGTTILPGAGTTRRGPATAAIPRVAAGSGSRVQRGRSNTTVLPLPPAGADTPTTAAPSSGSASRSASNSAVGNSAARRGE